MEHGPLAIAAAATVALLSTCATAPAETATRSCAERSKVIERLEERYGETLQSLGLQANSSVLEIYASETTGTWTILLTRPDGVSCLMASGQAWEQFAPSASPEGDDA
jgi:hypothetical protein